METNDKIALAQEISKRITADISAVWPGFEAVPFILYDDDSQVAVGPKWPDRYIPAQDDIWVARGHDPLLMGNTALAYHGNMVAIWDTRTWQGVPEVSQAAACIAHEMFHVFQRDKLKLSWANELLMPQYPHSPLSVTLVIEENKWLAEILAQPNVASVARVLQHIVALRKLREHETGGQFMEYDKRCESIEGTAAYVEVRMKAAIEGTAAHVASAPYLPVLSDRGSLLKNYRSRCYAAGLALCLAADAILPGWQARWAGSGETLIDWISCRLPHEREQSVINPLDVEAGRRLLLEFEHEKREKIRQFRQQELTCVKGSIQLTGFDPMNLTCVDSLCLHLHGMVRYEDKEQMLATPFLTEYGDNILDVKRIFIPSAVHGCNA